MEFKVEAGQSIYSAIHGAKIQCLISGFKYVDTVFNGIRLRVSVDSYEEDIATIYNLKHQLRRYTGV